MEQKEKDAQREEDMLFLNRLLATFVEDVLKETPARLDTDAQFINNIREDIVGIMKKRFEKEMSCKKNGDCEKGRRCKLPDGVCVSEQTSFTWPFSDAG